MRQLPIQSSIYSPPKPSQSNRALQSEPSNLGLRKEMTASMKPLEDTCVIACSWYRGAISSFRFSLAVLVDLRLVCRVRTDSYRCWWRRGPINYFSSHCKDRQVFLRGTATYSTSPYTTMMLNGDLYVRPIVMIICCK